VESDEHYFRRTEEACGQIADADAPADVDVHFAGVGSEYPGEARTFKQPLNEPSVLPQMAVKSANERKADLAAVRVARKHEVYASASGIARYTRRMGDKQLKGVFGRALDCAGKIVVPRERIIHTNKHDPLASPLDHDVLVDKHAQTWPVQVFSAAAAVPALVLGVSVDCIGLSVRVHARKELSCQPRTLRADHDVARQDDQIRAEAANQLLHSPFEPAPVCDVQVGHLKDREAVERGREPAEAKIEAGQGKCSALDKDGIGGQDGRCGGNDELYHGAVWSSGSE